MMLPQNMELVDADGSGTLDQEEFKKLLLETGSLEMAQAQALFEAADKDGDGELTDEEIKLLAGAKTQKFKARAA